MTSPSSAITFMPISKFLCFVPHIAWHRNAPKLSTTAKILKSPLQQKWIANTGVRKRCGHWQLASDEELAESTSLSMADGDGRGESRTNRVLEEIRQRLENELPGLFTSDSSDYEMYSPSVLFEDPLNKFRGTKRYASNISFLKESPVFTQAKFYLHSSRTLPDRNTIRTRWTLQMTVAALPWKPTVVFTGLSDYRVDLSSKLVIGHYDYWDSLASSKFFSPPAVVDLVSQCAPGSVLPYESLPSFVLLRRTQRLQVWKFDSEVTLIPVSNVQTADDSEPKAIFRPVLESDRTAAATSGNDYNGNDAQQQNSKSVTSCVAVARVDGKNQAYSEVRSIARTLRSAIASVPFADAADDSWLWVRASRGDRPKNYVDFVWIQLSKVNMDVETGVVS